MKQFSNFWGIRSVPGESDILIDGEKVLGQYMVAALQHFSDGTWEPGMLQLSATVTRYRLLLAPSPARKRYQPACLPGYHIKSVKMTERGGYHTLAISMPTRQVLYLTMSTGKLEDFYQHLATISMPERVRFDERIDRSDIQRLIGYFAGDVLVDEAE